MKKKEVTILNIPFYNITQTGFVEQLYQDVQNGNRKFVVTANPEIVMHASTDKEFEAVLLQADYIVPDGIGIIMASEKLGTPLEERVTGYDTMVGLLNKPLRCYFLGAKPEVSQMVEEKVSKKYPNVVICGVHHGYFDAQESEEIGQEIMEAKPDIIFVALGSPAQEKWILSQINHFEKGIFIGVGGSFDVLTDNVKRAPKIWIKLRLEWVYRLLSNPSRWRRFFAIPQFMLAIRRESKHLKKGE
ncbi:WecB/TagA/CpsF family glycosyltransferase [Listeria ivanovii]|uniref:N-acetylglucosaminyldiphosphoundecaprenol N-acetyl-beta-D-mannosaminyltransferase n=1 Tax=Listeria ivanovii (strain ATCC BAA-678 / PAM 55) TaxID=881621 RepID=G2ZFF8_LISIP|nr:WecB/TagA/CpsF family glycosyltransferase [Listeria ivanovii]AHI56946.1 acetylglucosaminyldiphosphoundecaprenol acetyl-beta-D-mannosaminyltransferase [Listeria ivanovii WSLC3009]AIS66362.1 acetylglucosaminyldiphospho-UDP acetyl-beta-D-mannosaminyltransferase [Listeria ivanovii subsp. ivanovii]MBC1759836.1 WecB/TagA/CpsF family glycosyltransferase [Listeria ivanovii]MCJ1718205.1 WecB/TagA/CpsF family glycosyltransferase [Listeria ivanovii]MCJ1723317.1 WecB/TagA/CpsF family glycosyltransferas